MLKNYSPFRKSVIRNHLCNKAASYSSPEVLEARLQVLKPILLEEALVRDMHGGDWWQYIKAWINDLPEQCHPKARELLKQIGKNKRLRTVAYCGVDKPCCPQTWFDEAIASHNWENLIGIIASKEVARQHRTNPAITSIEQLTNHAWLQRRGASIRLPKQSSDYLANLRLLLSQANSIQFIDPYLDPTQPHYEQFYFLLKAIKQRDCPPLLELHTSAKGTDVTGQERKHLTQSDWKSRFSSLSAVVQDVGLTATVYVWEKFHDRFILSNLASIGLSSGLDIHPHEPTIWSRLPRDLRDQCQSDFSANSAKYNLKCKFILS